MAAEALLSKLEKAELRFGLCDDGKLSALLDPALPNILGFLANGDAAVRAKVMSILSHLNKRIRGDPAVRLPLGTLSRQFCSPATNGFVSNFALVYLEMGLARAPAADRASLVPALLAGVAQRSAAQQETLLQLLLSALPDLPIPEHASDLAATLPFLVAPADRALILEWLLDLLQYLPPLAEATAAAPPGLSPAAAKRVCGKLDPSEVRGELLAAKKLAATRLLSAPAGRSDPREAGGLFSPVETLPHWLVAACDGDGAVQSAGEVQLRKLSVGVDLEQPKLVDALCRLVVGSASGQPRGPGERLAAAVAVRVRALWYLSRSVAAASHFPGVVQATFHSIFGEDATPKLRQAGCILAEWVVTHAQMELLSAAGAHLHAGLMRVLRGEAHPGLRPEAPEAVSMRSHAYSALAAMARRAPSLLRADETLPAELFRALQSEDAGARTALHEALAALADVHAPSATGRPLPEHMASRLGSLLASSAAGQAPQARLAAMAWAGRVFPRSDVPTRLVCLTGAADARSEVREAALAALRPPDTGRGKAGGAGLGAGARVVVEGALGNRRLGLVLSVHTDDAEAAYFTVRVGGHERSVEAARLTPLPDGWPAFGEVAAAVLQQTDLPRLEAAAGGVWETSPPAAAAAGLPALPVGCTAETLRYLSDCLSLEAHALYPHTRRDAAAGLHLSRLLEEDGAGQVSGSGQVSGAVQLLALLGRCLFSPHEDASLVLAAARQLHALVQGAAGAGRAGPPGGIGTAASPPGGITPPSLCSRVAAAETPLLRLALGAAACKDEAQRMICEALAMASPNGEAAQALLRSAMSSLPSLETGCAGPSESRRAVGAALLAGFVTAQLAPPTGGAGAALPGGIDPAVRGEATSRLAALVEHRQPLVACAAVAAVGLIGAAGPLPLSDGPATEPDETAGGGAADAAGGAAADTAGGAAATASAGEERADGGAAARGIPAAPPPTGASKRGLISALCLLLKKEKVRDAAVVSLGQITAGEPDAAFRNQALQALFGMASTKDIELQLSVGQALARLASASPAGSAAPPPPPKIEPPERPAIPSELATLPERAAAAAAASTVGKGDRLLAYVLARVLLQHAVAWAPLERQAAAAWLLAILRAAATAGSQTDVRASAGAIQGVLVGLLADAHEATQELASKGLSALFDCCDEASRKTILSQLVSGLHTTRGANASASGGEMSTYRELSEIAANVGQPQLVYKLMECAASSAVWNTRKGVAFALAEHSREALDEHLPSLLPSLYRHTHDPNPRVAGAMRQLWASLVPDPKQALTAHLQPVLRHLCDSLGDRLWRAREGACLALAELLPGRTHAELAPMLSELHTKLLRTLDDIKETVRAAAEAAWRALCSACVRLTDGAKATEAEAGAVLAVVLPALLDGGVLNASAEVRAACTRQLLKLVQGAGPHLASHTPRLVPFLVESLSSLEDPSLLYMQHHVPGLGVSAGAFEHARVAANRGSPAAAALQQCLRVMSDEHVAAVLPPLTDTLARGTGLPSRAGAAHTVMQLAQAHPVAVAPHAGRTLAVLARAIPDERSVAARRAYTSAAAQLARLTKPEPLGDMLKAFADRYATGAVTTNEEGERLVLATLVRELGRGAPDAMAGLQADWLPLAYVGRHEPRWESEADEPGRPAGQLASVWEEAYDEGGGGPGAAAAHLPELLELLARLVDGQSWALRRAAAAALMELAAQGGGALASRPDAAPAMAALAAKLREHSRRWVDKEALLPKLDAVLPPPDDPPAATMEAEPTSGDF